MSYAPAARPVPLTAAAVLLWVMAAAGLGYAVAMLAVAPGTVRRFREAAGADPAADGFIAVVWIEAAVAVLVAILLFALYVVLGLGLRRGSRPARIATLVVCGLGLLGGLVTAGLVLAQRAGDAAPGSLGASLADSYPGGWLGLNLAVAIAQALGYAVVGLLLMLSGGGRPAPDHQHPSGAHPYPGFPPPATDSRAQWGPPPAVQSGSFSDSPEQPESR